MAQRAVVGSPDRRQLLERDAELARVRGLAQEAAHGRGCCLVVTGPPGIGKSTLAGAAADAGRAIGAAVARTVGGVLERDHPFAATRGLLEPLLAQVPAAGREAVFGGAAAGAAHLLGFGAPSAGFEDMGSILHGLYWLVANLAEHGPLLLIADDAQWFDLPSLRFLAYLARRLDGLRVGLLVSCRPPEPGSEGDVLAALLADPAVELLQPSPLSSDAVATLVRERLTDDADDAFCRACAEAGGGNPFLTIELLMALRDADVAPTAASASDVAEVGARRAGKAILRRLSGLPASATQVARAVAVLGTDAQLHNVAEISALPLDDAAQAADLLVRSDLLLEERPLRFSHPLVRAAVYESIGPGARARDHARAARLIDASGAAVDHVAAQLLVADPASDPWAAGMLFDAGRAAMAQGAPDSAGRFLDRALMEPPPPERRIEVLVELGGAERALNRPRAAAHLEEALRLCTDVASRVEIARSLGRALLGMRRGRESVLVMQAVRAEVDDPALRLRLDAPIAITAINAADAAEVAMPDVEALCRRVEGGDDLSPDAAVLGAVVAATRNRPCQPLGRRVAEVVATHRGRSGRLPYWSASAQWVLTMCEHPETLAATDWLIDVAQRQGESYPRAVLLSNKAIERLRRGDLSGAEADARISVEIDVVCDAQDSLAEAVACLIEVLVLRGDNDAAAALLAEHDLDGPIDPHPAGPEFTVRARGLLRLAQGRGAEALVDLRSAGQRCLTRGILSPAHLPWRSDLAVALAVAGEHDEAVRFAREEVDLAQSFGAPRTLGNALRCLGTLEGDESLLTEAVSVLESANADLAYGLALVELGSLQRRRNSRAEARAPLAQGLDLATRCGATVLAARAAAEISLSGGRPRRTAVTGRESLTAAELRVVTLAAEGHSNKEIAQAMFVSLKTIETQLGAAYRKLQVSSRKDLAAALV